MLLLLVRTDGAQPPSNGHKNSVRFSKRCWSTLSLTYESHLENEGSLFLAYETLPGGQNCRLLLTHKGANFIATSCNNTRQRHISSQASIRRATARLENKMKTIPCPNMRHSV
ncbi:unnamed protein product [Discosporangium mesarthrocarpum]